MNSKKNKKGLTLEQIKILTGDKKLADYFEKVVKILTDKKNGKK